MDPKRMQTCSMLQRKADSTPRHSEAATESAPKAKGRRDAEKGAPHLKTNEVR